MRADGRDADPAADAGGARLDSLVNLLGIAVVDGDRDAAPATARELLDVVGSA
jgi:hypothetical protein